MAEVILPAVATPPNTARMTYEEYRALPQADRLIEWVNGEVIYHMPPLEIHQSLVGYLYHLLRSFVSLFDLGRVYVAPFEMKCRPEASSREPDILFVAQANVGRIGEKMLAGPADLIVEVVSDDSVARDFDDKFIEYQDCGVSEYWIVDPRPRRQRALFHQRAADELFELIPPREGVYRSRVIPAFWLRTAWLWAMPDPLLTFAEIAGLSEATLAELQAKKAR